MKLWTASQSVYIPCRLVPNAQIATLADPKSDSHSTCFLLASAAFVVGAVAWVLDKRFRRPKTFVAFFSYHRVASKVAARYLQTLCSELYAVPVGRMYVETGPASLDDVCNAVKDDTGTLVVLRTAQSLTRHWGAAEIASAVANRVKLVVVRCDGAEDLEPQDLEQRLDSMWTLEQISELHLSGVSMDAVAAGMAALASSEEIEFCALHVDLHFTVAHDILAACKKVPVRTQVLLLQQLPTAPIPNSEAPVRILVSRINPEDYLAALCLARAFEHVHEPSVVADLKKAGALDGAAVVLVLSARASLEDVEFACHLARMYANDTKFVNVLVDDSNFTFPGGYCDEVAANLVFDSSYDKLVMEHVLGGPDAQLMAQAYSQLFQVLAISYFPARDRRQIANQFANIRQQIRLAKGPQFRDRSNSLISTVSSLLTSTCAAGALRKSPLSLLVAGEHGSPCQAPSDQPIPQQPRGPGLLDSPSESTLGSRRPSSFILDENCSPSRRGDRSKVELPVLITRQHSSCGSWVSV
mmetsp:Transcript_62439/g.167133  ORF Transcript_62439/g.167133 Transcript_62439/m.167133 type:complete len:526 (+) Transcript_62439:1277-2854(+)